jgi:phosphoglycolate phosphatase
MTPTITTGEGAAARFVEAAAGAFRDALGFDPYHGTLNLQGTEGLPELRGWMQWPDGDHCDGVAFEPCYVSGVRAAVIRPDVPGYPEEKAELVAPVRLRDLFAIEDGHHVATSADPWTEAAMTADPAELDGFETVVFDFDGTLAELAVDWPAVHEAIVDLLGDHLEKPLQEYERRAVFRIARETGVYDDLESVMATAERDAVPESTPRAELDYLTSLDRPVGICTANAAAAVRAFLDRHGLADTVDCVVARDTHPGDKPDPEPLVDCVEALGGHPGNALFVGDERTDATTADRAGTSFMKPGQLRPGP